MSAIAQTDERRTLPLEGLRVGLSGAVPERANWGKAVDLDRQILRFVSQFSSLVMAYGGEIVHGSQPSFAPVVAEAARRNGSQAVGDRAFCPLTLIVSRLWGKKPEVAVRAAEIAKAPILLTPKIGEGDAADPATRNDSLTAMRLVLGDRVDVMVAIGGKLHRDTGFNPGVLEELAQAKWHDACCFIVASEGMTGNLDPELLHALSEGNLIDTPENQDATLEMATWNENIDEYVGKLLVHLAKHRETFLKRRKGVDSSREGVGESDSGQGQPSYPPVMREVEVDAERVRQSSSKFKGLLDAINRKDLKAAGNILTSETSRDTHSIPSALADC
jgi:hypothetical protein